MTNDAAVEVELEVSEDEQPGREFAAVYKIILPKASVFIFSAVITL